MSGVCYAAIDYNVLSDEHYVHLGIVAVFVDEIRMGYSGMKIRGFCLLWCEGRLARLWGVSMQIELGDEFGVYCPHISILYMYKMLSSLSSLVNTYYTLTSFTRYLDTSLPSTQSHNNPANLLPPVPIPSNMTFIQYF